MSLKIYKIAEKVFRHNDTVKGDFVLSKFYAKEEFEKFIVVEIYGSEHLKYAINEIEVYDIGGMAETFPNFDDLFVRLAELRYTAFYADGESEVNWGFILGDINSQTDLITRLNAKLNNDISTYTGVTLPLVDDDVFLVNRGGTWFKVDKSEISASLPNEDILQYFKGDFFMCQATGASLTNIGYSANPALNGTGTNQLGDMTADYAVSPQTTWYHRRQISSSASGSSASATWQQRISSVGHGFYVSAKVNCTMVTDGRFFYGLTNSLSELPNSNPSTVINMIGFGIDSGDSNLQVIHNDSTGMATKVDLGVNFSIQSTNNPYLIEIWNFQGDSSVFFRVKNLLTNTTSNTIEVSTDLPTITTGLAMQLWVNNGSTASSIPLHFSNHTYKRQS